MSENPLYSPIFDLDLANSTFSERDGKCRVTLSLNRTRTVTVGRNPFGSCLPCVDDPRANDDPRNFIFQAGSGFVPVVPEFLGHVFRDYVEYCELEDKLSRKIDRNEAVDTREIRRQIRRLKNRILRNQGDLNLI
ncbi:hypothetical protein [Ponticaulis sp.]|uniref:hypothetical protein n=1 Tax=Ponticaulis sp. TaxID=2020902 RepID=UPI000C3FD040|nr:hypothetical protein [Ponticaulis sp.]MAF58892.1 hypothetical protein [Ponticaulis sp.]MBN03850.1 hypothetical protein [Ponticaulis sp.]|tara:strand:- start:433 stop:837 length:405 start_codon:yes stop_codon:yes gene_type:complete